MDELACRNRGRQKDTIAARSTYGGFLAWPSWAERMRYGGQLKRLFLTAHFVTSAFTLTPPILLSLQAILRVFMGT